ncbi:L,D-transpeptidase family protein [Acetobacteraceae bacterium H6797]|nr:L,D-transpeptidase family protein [Acetobacteraceae bacterium H6797]
MTSLLTARLLPGASPTEGLLAIGAERFRCAIGKGGIREDKSEGDGATPRGLLSLRRLLYRADRGAPPPNPGHLRLEPIAPSDGWCDDPSSPAYNTQIALPHPARHEKLWREDGVYDLIGVLGWNDAPVQRGRGSAIFLHVARPDYAPTEGCIALSMRDLHACLRLGLGAIAVP